jgi:hypothetical protein
VESELRKKRECPALLFSKSKQQPWVKIRDSKSWALALYFQVRSPLISYPWITIALAVIWPIFEFTHRSIALKKPVVRSWKRVLKRKIAHKTSAVHSPPSFSGACCVCLYSTPPPPPAWREFQVIHTALIHADSVHIYVPIYT